MDAPQITLPIPGIDEAARTLGAHVTRRVIGEALKEPRLAGQLARMAGCLEAVERAASAPPGPWRQGLAGITQDLRELLRARAAAQLAAPVSAVPGSAVLEQRRRSQAARLDAFAEQLAKSCHGLASGLMRLDAQVRRLEILATQLPSGATRPLPSMMAGPVAALRDVLDSPEHGPENGPENGAENGPEDRPEPEGRADPQGSAPEPGGPLTAALVADLAEPATEPELITEQNTEPAVAPPEPDTQAPFPVSGRQPSHLIKAVAGLAFAALLGAVLFLYPRAGFHSWFDILRRPSPAQARWEQLWSQALRQPVLGCREAPGSRTFMACVCPLARPEAADSIAAQCPPDPQWPPHVLIGALQAILRVRQPEVVWVDWEPGPELSQALQQLNCDLTPPVRAARTTLSSAVAAEAGGTLEPTAQEAAREAAIQLLRYLQQHPSCAG